MRLQVSLPPDVDVAVIAIHEKDAVQTQQSADKRYGEWQLNEVVLPYQGIMFRWRFGEIGLSNPRASEERADERREGAKS